MNFLIFAANIVALLFSFFVVGVLIGVLLSKPFRDAVIEIVREYGHKFRLIKPFHNPILHPGTYPWTAEAVLNPAAAVLADRTHLIYRAIGMDGVSRLGYASSKDGYIFDERLPYPVFVVNNPRKVPHAARRYSPIMYPSGGSWGGCEDPRMVAIDGRLYMTYNAFDGWDFIRVALTSIAVEDFVAKRFWKWRAPKLISKSGQRHKNWVIFPEKVNGRFAILHNIHSSDPDHVLVEYVDDLDTFDGDQTPIVSPDPASFPSHVIAWHNKMRSAGPPPVKTKHGWLVFYHATSPDEGHRYKLGAMLLDLDDPTKVAHRAIAPVVSPDEHYENDGKPGIVYACGAVIRGDTLFVYYGGADKVVCVATAPLDEFLEALIEGSKAVLATHKALTK